MQISTAEIRQAVNTLLAHFEEHGAGIWEIDESYFWDVPTAARYEMDETPSTTLTIGDLTDDVAHVRSIAAGLIPPQMLGLVWIANIFRYAGPLGPVSLARRSASDSTQTED